MIADKDFSPSLKIPDPLTGIEPVLRDEIPWLTIDFETRSAVRPNEMGYYHYAHHSSTQILCCCYKVSDGDTVFIYSDDPRVVQAIDPNDLPSNSILTLNPPWYLLRDNPQLPVLASNVAFDSALWKKMKWPAPPYGFADMMAVQRSYNLPGGLDDAAQYLLGVGKEEAGSAAVKALNARVKGQLRPFKAQVIPDLITYCVRDVRLTEAMARTLGLFPQDPISWLSTWNMNERGFQVDAELAWKAIHALDKLDELIMEEVTRMTDGGLEGHDLGSNQKLAQWLASRGFKLPKTDKGNPQTDKATLTGLTELALDPVAEYVVKARLALKATASKKFKTLIDCQEPDGRIKQTLLYNQARTGRWAGRLFQPQNIKRVTTEEVETVLEVLETDQISSLGDPVQARERISTMVRPCMVAKPGYKLIMGDLAQIETRVLFWLAEDQETLGIFREGDDLYKEMAGTLFNVTHDQVTKAQRQIGKAAILGLGFGQGINGFQSHYGALLKDAGVTADQVVRAYRTRFQKVSGVKGLWANYGMALELVMAGHPSGINGCCLASFGRKLIVQLPSDRKLVYWEPKLDACREGSFSYSQFEDGHWTQKSLYRGKLTENIVQATARDILAYSMNRLEAILEGELDPDEEKPPMTRNPPDAGWAPIMTIHDEIILEAREEIAEEVAIMLQAVMETPPGWASDLPMAAEVSIGDRYLK